MRLERVPVEVQPRGGGAHEGASGGERDVLPHREAPVDARDLEGVHDAGEYAGPRRGTGDVPALETDAPGARPDPPADHADEGRLAGAVRPDDGVDVARPHRDGNAIDRGESSETPAQPLGLKQRGVHRLVLPRAVPGALPERFGLPQRRGRRAHEGDAPAARGPRAARHRSAAPAHGSHGASFARTAPMMPRGKKSTSASSAPPTTKR